MVVKIRHQSFLAGKKEKATRSEKRIQAYGSLLVKFPLLFLPSLTHIFILSSDMRRDVQEVFRMTPHEKQVMMFSATLAKEIRPVCKKFMQDVIIPPKFHCQVCC